MTAGTEDLDALYAELQPLLAGIGVDTTAPDRAQMDGQIIEVGKTIAPLAVHPHLVWFWRHWPHLGGECTMPAFMPPEFGLKVRQATPLPPTLLAFGYGNNQCLFAEVSDGDDGDGPGPRIYAWDMLGGRGLQLVFLGFADLLRYLITMLETGESTDLIAHIDRLVAWLPPGVSAEEKKPIEPIDPAGWPDRWKLISGVSDDL